MNKKGSAEMTESPKDTKKSKEKKVSFGILPFMVMIKVLHLTSECLSRVCTSVPLWTVCHPGSSVQGRGGTYISFNEQYDLVMLFVYCFRNHHGVVTSANLN